MVTGGKSILDKLQKSTTGPARDHIERHEHFSSAHQILVMCVKDPEIVRGPIVGGVGDLDETERSEPGIDPGGGDAHEVEARLGGDDGEISGRSGIDDDSLERIETRDKLVLEEETFQVFERRGFPKVEATGILRRGNERQLDAGSKAEDSVAGHFHITITDLVVKQVMLLSAANGRGREAGDRQETTETFRPFSEVCLLPGKSGRPRWSAIC